MIVWRISPLLNEFYWRSTKAIRYEPVCPIAERFGQTSRLLLCLIYFRLEKRFVGGFGKRYSNKGNKISVG
jgi:hypothetical protein